MKDCFWTVFSRREGVVKSFDAGKAPAQAKGRARAWQKKNRPRGTRLVYMCVPPR